MTRPASRGGAWPASVVNDLSRVPALAALAHPDRVARIVLDSVVPHNADFDLVPLELRAAGQVLLAGGHDLSTPLERTRREAALAPGGRLVMLAGAGHDVQIRAAGDRGRKAIQAFLD